MNQRIQIYVLSKLYRDRAIAQIKLPKQSEAYQSEEKLQRRKKSVLLKTALYTQQQSLLDEHMQKVELEASHSSSDFVRSSPISLH